VTDADATSLDADRGLTRALELAYRHLSRRDRTEAQVRRHLAGRGVQEPAIDGAVRVISEQGYLDDARYARVFAEDRRSLDGWGSERIERALLAAGVELDAAVALLRRRCRTAPATDRERERALGLLVRKGYELELAYDAVRAFERAAMG